MDRPRSVKKSQNSQRESERGLHEARQQTTIPLPFHYVTKSLAMVRSLLFLDSQIVQYGSEFPFTLFMVCACVCMVCVSEMSVVGWVK